MLSQLGCECDRLVSITHNLSVELGLAWSVDYLCPRKETPMPCTKWGYVDDGWSLAQCIWATWCWRIPGPSDAKDRCFEWNRLWEMGGQSTGWWRYWWHICRASLQSSAHSIASSCLSISYFISWSYTILGRTNWTARTTSSIVSILSFAGVTLLRWKKWITTVIVKYYYVVAFLIRPSALGGNSLMFRVFSAIFRVRGLWKAHLLFSHHWERRGGWPVLEPLWGAKMTSEPSNPWKPITSPVVAHKNRRTGHLWVHRSQARHKSGFLKRALAHTCLLAWYQVRFSEALVGILWALCKGKSAPGTVPRVVPSASLLNCLWAFLRAWVGERGRPWYSSGASVGSLYGCASFKVEKAHFAAWEKGLENRKNEVKLPGSFAAANFSIFLICLCLLGTKSRSTDLWPWTPKRAVILDLHCKNWDQSSLLPPKRAMILDLHCKNWETPVNFCAQMLVFKGFEVATQGFGWPFLAHFGGVCRFGQKWASHYIAPYTKWALFGRGGSNLSFGGGVGGWGVSKTFFSKGFGQKGPSCLLNGGSDPPIRV